MNDVISPVRRKFDVLVLTILGIAFLGAIPMAFCEKLEGFFLIYFIIYLTLVVMSIFVLLILYPFVRKCEIKFFTDKFNVDNMEKLVNFNFNEEDFFFYVGKDIQLTTNGIKDLLNEKEYLYSDFNIYATYLCGFAGEIYKIFINFENKEESISLKLDNVLYSIIKYYKIDVKSLEDIMNACESNLNTFFKSKKLRKDTL